MGFDMTPKEKAKELWNKFFYAQLTEGDFTLDGEIAYKCALIAVDEILEAIHFDWIEEQNLERQRNYWNQVKNEIEEL
jgi:hypothetical protein